MFVSIKFVFKPGQIIYSVANFMSRCDWKLL